MFISHEDEGQGGFHILGALLALLVVLAAGFAGLLVFQKMGNKEASSQHGPNYNALSTCADQPLNTLPTDLSKLEQIAPLGGLNPPSHTLPTDHMYMMYPYGDSTQQEVYAPADIVVTGIAYSTDHESGKLITADHSITFSPCDGLVLIYGHIDTISESLNAAVGQDFENKVGCNTSTQGPHEIMHCIKQVDLTIKAGELLGTSNGWDLWATKEDFVSPQVTSPEYYHNVDAVCPLDYFTDELQSQLYKLVKRTTKPRCGEAYQDKANTLQGGWFVHQDPEKGKTDWISQMSLAHHASDNAGMLAIAGTILDKDYMIRFTSATSGSINREPSQTKAGTVYCYQHEGEQRMSNGYMAGTGKILLKLLDNHTMQIEHQTGACAANESFSKPSTYYR